MPNIARLSIQKPLYPWILLLACLFGGLYGIDTVGRLEDPPFPLKIALIITPYPGASAEEVEHEVTDVIEASLQELAEVDELTSKSVPGRSEIQVQIQEEYDDIEVQQIFDELRRRVQEASIRLPPGAGQPHRGGPRLTPQHHLPQGPLSVALRHALLHRLPGD